MVSNTEERLSFEHLCKDASYTEHVNSLCVLKIVLMSKKQLWSSVDPSSNVLCVFRMITFVLVIIILRDDTRETEVTDLDVAVRVNQDITGFQITMNNLRLLKIPQTVEELEENVLDMIF